MLLTAFLWCSFKLDFPEKHAKCSACMLYKKIVCWHQNNVLRDTKPTFSYWWVSNYLGRLLLGSFMLRIWWLVKASNEIFLTTHLIISCYTYNPYMTTYLTWKKGDRLICLILKKGAYIFKRWRFSRVLEIPRHAKYKVTNRPFLYVSVVSTPQIGKFVTVYLKYEEEKH